MTPKRQRRAGGFGAVPGEREIAPTGSDPFPLPEIPDEPNRTHPRAADGTLDRRHGADLRGACRARETAVEFPATEIEYAAITWDDPEVEMRQLSLEDVVEQLAFDFLSDTHGGWENNDGAYGEFCFDAAARCIHLEFNERLEAKSNNEGANA